MHEKEMFHFVISTRKVNDNTHAIMKRNKLCYIKMKRWSRGLGTKSEHLILQNEYTCVKRLKGNKRKNADGRWRT